MPVYTFRCDLHDPPIEGDVLRDTHDTTPPLCPAEVVNPQVHMDGTMTWGGTFIRCGAVMKRVYTPFGFKRPMPAHFNLAAGEFVTNASKLQDAFNRKSESESARLGMDVNYQVVEPADQQAVFKTDEQGMDDTYRKRREMGMTQRKQLWL